VFQCIDPNGGDKPEFGKIDAQTNSRALAHERSECGSVLALVGLSTFLALRRKRLMRAMQKIWTGSSGD
jgi:hypothetical protein